MDSIWVASGSKKWHFWLKMLCGYIRNCASYAGGEHIFRKIMKTGCQNVKNAVKIMSDTSKCHQHSVAYMKMSSEWCRIHGSTRPRKPPVAIIHIFAKIVEVQLGGHGAEKKGKGANDRAIGPNSMTRTGSIWAASTSKKWDFSLKRL